MEWLLGCKPQLSRYASRHTTQPTHTSFNNNIQLWNRLRCINTSTNGLYKICEINGEGRVTTDEKANNLINTNSIFKLLETTKRTYYICTGTKNQQYNVIYDKQINKYSCDCNNIKFSECSHIKAAKLLKN